MLPLHEREIVSMTLRRCANIDCMWTRWCWISPSQSEWIANLQRREGEFGVVLTATERGVVETAATPLTMAILETFEGDTEVTEGVATVVGYFRGVSAETDGTESIVRQQLREVLTAGFLEVAEWG